MSTVILDQDGLVAARIVGGTAFGFKQLTPCISIATSRRGCDGDSLVLTLYEAKCVAEVILKELNSLPGISG